MNKFYLLCDNNATLTLDIETIRIFDQRGRITVNSAYVNDHYAVFIITTELSKADFGALLHHNSVRFTTEEGVAMYQVGFVKGFNVAKNNK